MIVTVSLVLIQFTGPAANIINQTLAYEIQERKMKN